MLEHIQGLFSNIRVIDFIDIGVIAVFIYMLLVWFEQARARFVMMGLFILGSIYTLARLFGLYLTTIVFQAFFAIFLIIVVIIFQDEFRRFFERLALWGLIRNKKRFTSFDKNVDMLTNALVDLSNKKIGALVVIKGKDYLGRHIEGGLPLGGLISQIMLEAIFNPLAPTHDGAVIIEEGRIIEFGCHLPLSMNIREIGHLGTRHAAALGLAERTDALCIVVSEERGTISVAENGKIRLLKDVAALRISLEDFYRKRFPQRRNILSELLTGHILEKLTALSLACGLWMVFGHTQDIIRRDFIIPIEYRNLASEWIIAEPKPKEATVALSGTESAFTLMDSKDLKISLDMSKVQEGNNEFLFSKDSIRQPPGISVVDITPEKVALEAYRIVNVSIPVEAAVSGRLPFGVSLVAIKIEPQVISIIAPSALKDSLLKATTEDIDLRNINETQSLTVKLILPPQARFADDKQQEAKVTIEVEKK